MFEYFNLLSSSNGSEYWFMLMGTSGSELIQSIDTDSNNNPNELLKGGVNQDIVIYNIDYLLEDDEKLINTEKVIKQVDTYINNYNRENLGLGIFKSVKPSN
jgi:hypothetical protein